MSLKVLQLTTKPPVPPVDGGTRAMLSATEALLDSGCEVRVLSMCSEKHKAPAGPFFPTSSKKAEGNASAHPAVSIDAVPVDLRVRPLGALKALLLHRSYNIERFKSQAFRQRLCELLQHETFDVVQLESLYLLPYVPTVRSFSTARVVLRAHNVEWQIWQRLHLAAKHSPKRWYLATLAQSLRRYERQHINDCDGVVFISGDDEAAYLRDGLCKPHTVIPYGFDRIPFFPTQPESAKPADRPLKLFHIGAMDWQPNLEAIQWFLDKVWPEVHRRLPGVELHLAGRRMPPHIAKQPPEGVVVAGEVPDADSFVEAGDICVVPLLSGSGMRVKIIEAMAHGKAVVATSVAAQGIQCTDGVEILIADNASQFAEQIVRCATNAGLRRSLGANAATLVEQRYSNKAIASQWIKFYTTIFK